jgi:hypothetical protein
MSRSLKTMLVPALAGSLLLMMSGFDLASAATRHQAASHHSRSTATQSYDAVPGPLSGAMGSPRFSPYGTSAYPFGPGQNFPYPDRPYGDPDHW